MNYLDINIVMLIYNFLRKIAILHWEENAFNLGLSWTPSPQIYQAITSPKFKKPRMTCVSPVYPASHFPSWRTVPDRTKRSESPPAGLTCRTVVFRGFWLPSFLISDMFELLSPNCHQSQ